ncbi:PREDICTED: glutathione S-transferase T3-like [Brassica oleracea var. oleracea]|uniref:glutathione S-transferase T3-like n=1 Tax=Brassica oleracea var. oleracea TaxID=109376 RepID=UPI0006A755FF|nr:PREDICTED: glutathione S-transferase T3-like [Brassica oleracea var. oleracea]
MDSTNPYTRPSNFTDLLNSQQDSGLPVPSSYESFSHGGVLSSQIPMFSSQPSETASFCEDSPTEKKERKKWSVSDDLVLISAWLNTSNDPVVSNEKRIANYFAASPQVARGEEREPIQCKQRWQKVNDLVCKFCGAYAAATRQKTSGQSESDVVKLAHQIFYNDHKMKFNLHHAWEELKMTRNGVRLRVLRLMDHNHQAVRGGGVRMERNQLALKQPRIELITLPHVLLVLRHRKEHVVRDQW